MTTAFSSNTGLLTSSSGGAAMRDVLQAAGEEVMDAVRDSTKAGQLMDAVELAQNRQNHVNASGETVADVFRRLDKDGGGELDRRETRRALKELGIDPDSKLVQRQVKKFDSDGSGSLDLEEFEAFVDSILRAEDDPDSAAILEAFHNLPFMTGVSTGDRMGCVALTYTRSSTCTCSTVCCSVRRLQAGALRGGALVHVQPAGDGVPSRDGLGTPLLLCR